MIVLWILIGFCINMVIGAGVCAALDTEDQVFNKWYKEAPFISNQICVLTLWPIMAWYMLKYKKCHEKYNL